MLLFVSLSECMCDEAYSTLNSDQKDNYEVGHGENGNIREETTCYSRINSARKAGSRACQRCLFEETTDRHG